MNEENIQALDDNDMLVAPNLQEIETAIDTLSDVTPEASDVNSVEDAKTHFRNIAPDDNEILDSDFKWYCVRVHTGHEEQVKKTVESEVKRLEMECFVRGVIVPNETVFEVRNGKKRTSIRNFLPGYILINAVISEQKKSKNKVLDAVGNLTGVVSFVGRKNDPAPLQQNEVDRIFARINERADVATIDTTYRNGDPIKVIVGPFSGFAGTVLEVNNEKRKLKVEIIILGRKTPVTLDYDQVEFDKPE
jgi:transcriptional antiterminator NusG